MNMEYWKRFENSGRIEDYLNFVSCERQERSASGADFERNGTRDAGTVRDGRPERYSGEDSYAGKHDTDGNCIEAVSRGGI